MSFCTQLTNKGLLQILQLCGSTLRSLDISRTNITGENLSEYKGTLPCLENLNMSFCTQLTNKGLLQILQLCGSTLRSLDISRTNITGENLTEYKGTLPCLKNLNMELCRQLTNKGLLQILQLCGSTLRSLNIGLTNITGENLSEYKGTLPCLESLNMGNCKQLTNKGLLQILQLCGSTLRSLDILNSNITGENLSEYKGTLPCLDNLELNYCEKLTDNGLRQILQLCGSTLRSLDITGTNVTGENLTEYKGTLPCLQNLKMRDCEQLTNKGLLQILQLCGSTLRSLNIGLTNITGENLSEYKGTLPCLESLNMGNCKQLTNKGLLQILQLCGSTLRSMDIGLTNITGEYLSEYKGTLPCLENLNMRNCKQLTNKGLLQILQLCGSTLRSLDILGTNVTGENLTEYKGTLPCLKNLNMGACKQLTDKGLLHILQLCGSTLKSLNIACTAITGENLSAYKITLPCLENLNMRDCEQLTDKGLLQILQLCGSTLRSLDILNSNITGENLSEYKGTLPCLDNLELNYCEQLTDNGLRQILQLCGSTLRSLDITGTNITGEYLSQYIHVKVTRG
ncbi:F-box/LRR-repeat protein 14 [Eurytemora carolleeae]|uniref:F-box/LRR-repeat protein 14 n=1 Tax=Eurytemora carolleeae TaxID=1294199 RepID=UPI000C75A14C|nr:F-box/LRR-repeat protein 14 [Eurytemora carolleeae]|eukprot:XP_023343578.1 F-box/LRR-repeat protein 14-like [Eurytemora affinis]